MKRVVVVSVGRSDFAVYLPLLEALREDAGLELALVAGGMHLAPEFGTSVREIERLGWTVAQRVEMVSGTDTPEATAEALARGVTGFSRALAAEAPAAVVVLGDRWEMLAAALAAVPYRVPLVHLYGGEVTEGSTDDAFRHALTKLAHLHCVSTRTYGRRVVQLGEEPWRVHVTGSLAVDQLVRQPRLSPAEFEARFGVPLRGDLLLVTFHPATTDPRGALDRIDALLDAVSRARRPVLFTAPGADPGWRAISERIAVFVDRHAEARFVPDLGPQGYATALASAAAMVGNSSSGIVESPTFGLPVVNVGDRQAGRLRAANVIDVGYAADEILSAIERATSDEFRSGLAGLASPFGDGRATGRVLEVVRAAASSPDVLHKRFHDVAFQDPPEWGGGVS